MRKIGNTLLVIAAAAVWLVIGAFELAPQCAQEDGSGQVVCYWDAQEEVNGVGSSYLTVGDPDNTANRIDLHWNRI